MASKASSAVGSAPSGVLSDPAFSIPDDILSIGLSRILPQKLARRKAMGNRETGAA